DVLLLEAIDHYDSTTPRHSAIFRNDSGTFHDIGAVLTYGNAAAWGDYDNDGDLDLVISGPTAINNANPVVKIYRNDNGTLVDINAPIPGLVGTVAWGDYDNDGDLDLFVTGSPDAAGSFYSRIYRNDGGNFVDIGVNLPGGWASSAAWGDYDNDGDLDLVLIGYGTYRGTPFLFRNDGPSLGSGWTFTNINPQIIPLANGQVAWADYDGDGYLDLVATGTTYGQGGVTKIYRNDGHGGFVDIGAPLKQLGVSGAAWGDYDNDGQPDLIVKGAEDFFGTNPSAKIYRNNNGTFVDIDAAIIPTWFGNVAWGDFDNDGDLDILTAGATITDPPFYYATRIYRNSLGSNTFTENTVPTAPTKLSSTVAGDTVALTWNRSTDNETPQAGLTYNIRVGTTPGGVQKMTPLADPSTGYRKVVQLGNTSYRNSWTLKNLPPGTYYWSVQAIDNAFAGSPFAEEQSFTIYAISPQISPRILSVLDVPADQGGKVNVTWEATSLDVDVNTLSFYSIWRALPGGAPIPDRMSPRAKITPDYQGGAYRVKQLNGVNYAWQWVANQPAHRFTNYAYAAPTLYDSSSTTDGKQYFLISAQTSDPDVFYDSDVDSGYSADNLAPAPPQNLTGSYSSPSVRLHWNRNSEPDLKQYKIYRSSSPGLNPVTAHPIASTVDTFYVDQNLPPEVQVWYIVCAADIHDNLSLASREVKVLISEVTDRGGTTPAEYKLYQNYPNPFNPSTIVPFDVAHDGFVSIKVFNLLGQLVVTLVNNELTAGRYEVFVDAKGLLSGVYYCRMEVNQSKTGTIISGETKKLLLLR
ncbi:MAG: T9SS type A sorting domain-containing protein, partial [Ignavibacteria bacterium]